MTNLKIPQGLWAYKLNAESSLIGGAFSEGGNVGLWLKKLMNMQENSEEIVNIALDTKYTKKVLAKNNAGSITDYQADVVTTFLIKKVDNSESFVVNEKFNFKKMTDKYEEKNYERNIKKNLANSISQKIILRLAVIK